MAMRKMPEYSFETEMASIHFSIIWIKDKPIFSATHADRTKFRIAMIRFVANTIEKAITTETRTNRDVLLRSYLISFSGNFIFARSAEEPNGGAKLSRTVPSARSADGTID